MEISDMKIMERWTHWKVFSSIKLWVSNRFTLVIPSTYNFTFLSTEIVPNTCHSNNLARLLARLLQLEENLSKSCDDILFTVLSIFSFPYSI